MQTLEFTRALKEIVEELRIAPLVKLLEEWTTPGGQNTAIASDKKQLFSALLFKSNAGYELLLRQPNTRQILEKMQVSQLYQPSRTLVMLSQLHNSPNTHNISANAEAFPAFYSLVAQLRTLQQLELTCRELLEDAKRGNLQPTEGIMEISLIEYSDEVGISPRRLRIFVSTITDLHEHLSRIHGHETDKITFKYFDSGSGFTIGVQGGKEVIEAMNTLLTQWWEKFRFWRYDTFEKKMEGVSKGLAIVETLQQAIEKGTITPEVGENLKLRIFREVETLTGIGATIPLGEKTSVDQLQLLTEMRNTKLLGSGNASEAAAEEKGDHSGG